MRFSSDGLSEPFPISLFTQHTHKHRANLQCPMNDSALCSENPKKSDHFISLWEQCDLHINTHKHTPLLWQSYPRTTAKWKFRTYFFKKQGENVLSSLLKYWYNAFLLLFSVPLSTYQSDFLNLLFNVLSEFFLIISIYHSSLFYIAQRRF